MPIHEEAYVAWEGAVLERPKTWLVIARTGVRLVWRKLLVVVLIFSSVPFIVRAGQIYFASRAGVQSVLEGLGGGMRIDAGFFMSFMNGQVFALLVVVALCGAGLIAGDRRYKALPLYFARPVNFVDYTLGKFLIVAFYGSLITIAPGILLFIMQVLLTAQPGYVSGNYWIPLSVIVSGALALVVLGGVMLAVSAYARGIRSAVVAYFAVAYVPDLVANIMEGFRDIGWISVRRDIRQVTAALFGGENPYEFPVWVGALALVVIVCLCVMLLRMRIKPTEVVK